MLAARWIVGAPLGMGDNGEVYEAEEAQGGRLCAVKILDPSFRRGGPAWSSFQSEVRAVSALPVDGVARVYDLGIDGKLHRPFIVCERVMFPSLARLVAERGPLPPRVVEPALLTVARALDAIHGAGIAHGAIKPQNVFVSAENPSWARLTDYGLSRLKAAIDPQHAALGWTPPELTKGGVPEPAGDRYALALVTFFALTGMPWFSALGTRGASRPADWGTLGSPASARSRELGGALDPAFDLWFRAALAGDPASRYSSATEMAQAFSSIVQSMGAAEGGPLSGPGVVSAVAQPLVFRRNLPQADPAFDASARATAAAEQPPLPSEAHPFSPTVLAMPAISAPPAPAPAPQAISLGGTLVMQPSASPVAPAPQATALGGTLVVQPSASPFANAPPPALPELDPTYPSPVAPAEPPPPMPVYAYPAEPSQQAQPAPGGALPKGAVIGLFIAASLVFMALTVGAVVMLRKDDAEPAASAAASETAPAPKASERSAAPPPVEPAAPATAVPAAPEPPASVPPASVPAPPSAAVPAKPSVATVAPSPPPAKPAPAPATTKPAATKPSTQKPAAAKPTTTSKPATKKCGTFIPCK